MTPNLKEMKEHGKVMEHMSTNENVKKAEKCLIRINMRMKKQKR